MSFQPGSLVSARGRDWTVLPGSLPQRLLVRPLGGGSAEDAVLLPELEPVATSSFGLPDPQQAADNQHCRRLREALRLNNRNSAGPFRSFGRLGFEPHAYQLVPLLMSLRQEATRLLIADDVGTGKTPMACLIARELLDRGDIERFWVLTPPHLAMQWQQELKDKFHLDADVVLPGTVGRLEREGLPGSSIFRRDALIISLDFAKRDSHRDAVLAHAPELIIVDEAHTCSIAEDAGRSRHQRHRLIKDLAADPDRHVVLVTATPHSGKGGAFRSLVGLLDPGLAMLPDELSSSDRVKLARHLIQRRREDIKNDAEFPQRSDEQVTYRLTTEYSKLYDDVIELARETVERPGTAREQRIQWWSALSMLRALASSPRAAAASFDARTALADLEEADEADEAGAIANSDDEDEFESSERPDTILGSDYSVLSDDEALRRRFKALAKRAREFEGKGDSKLVGAVKQVEELLTAGHTPIVFCRFINTAEYVAEHLRDKFKDRVEVRPVTGKLPPEARQQQIQELGEAREAGRQAVLVATDCLSEGINLQHHFNAVLHYDLAWNPMRHEQREGRVDRFGQSHAGGVAIRTYYGINNPIDGWVWEVLFTKHRRIRADLQLAIPMPASTGDVMEAMLEGLRLKGGQRYNSRQGVLEGMETARQSQMYRIWDERKADEEKSRSIFAQSAIPLEELQAVLSAARRTAGSAEDVGRFVRDGLAAHQAHVTGEDPVRVRLTGLDDNLRDRLGLDPETDLLRLGFRMPVPEDAEFVPRTHPLVQGLAEYILDTALDPELEGAGGRCGAIFTAAVERSVVLVLARFRFNLQIRRAGQPRTLLAEDYGLLAFDLVTAEQLPRELGEQLLEAEPARAMHDDIRKGWVADALKLEPRLREILNSEAALRAQQLREEHERVRSAATRGRAGQIGSLNMLQEVQALSPVDIVGLYVYLPAGGPA